MERLWLWMKADDDGGGDDDDDDVDYGGDGDDGGEGDDCWANFGEIFTAAQDEKTLALNPKWRSMGSIKVYFPPLNSFAFLWWSFKFFQIKNFLLLEKDLFETDPWTNFQISE